MSLFFGTWEDYCITLQTTKATVLAENCSFFYILLLLFALQSSDMSQVGVSVLPYLALFFLCKIYTFASYGLRYKVC